MLLSSFLIYVFISALPEALKGRRFCSPHCHRYGEQKIARFRTHDLTNELAYVSTQQSGQFDTFLLNHFSVYWKVA